MWERLQEDVVTAVAVSLLSMFQVHRFSFGLLFLSFSVIMTRYCALIALSYLLAFRYPDATPEDLQASDNVCIICREEMVTGAKKLPCNHIFHSR